MKLEGKIDTKGFQNYLGDLGTRFGKDQIPEILRGEASKVIEGCMKYEKVAQTATLTRIGLRRGYNRRTDQTEYLSINNGKRGGLKNQTWYVFKTKNGRRVYRYAGVWSGKTSIPSGGVESPYYRSMWGRATSEARSMSQRMKETRGSTKVSWVEIMDGLKADTSKVPSYVRTSKRWDKKTGLGKTSIYTSPVYSSIKVINSSGMAAKNGGQNRLNIQISKRSGFW